MKKLFTYDELVEKSKTFFQNNAGVKVQTTANLIGNMRDRSETIERFANQAYPIIHETVVDLIKDFLVFKLQQGSLTERKLYRAMSVAEFVDRLVSKRPLVFFMPVDSWTTKEGGYGTGGWENIGTDKDGSQGLKLESFLSYDEIKLSALLQLSTPTLLINSGSRDNVGRPGQRGSFISEAVYVGVVGARFEVAGRMEYEDMIREPGQQDRQKGCGAETLQALFARFYGSHLNSESQRLVETGLFSSVYLDTDIYTKRIQISAETFLIEADHRGLQEDRDVYCHVVGLGLGVWKISSEQNKYFLREFLQLSPTLAWVNALKLLRLERVKNVNFSYISKLSAVPELQDGADFPGSDIRINFSRRDPFSPLAGADQDKLVVAMFAWDGNSYVGNEYWQGLLSASGDPAAACCSNIPELLNPDINPAVRGENTRVATRDRGVVTLAACQATE